MHINTNPNCIWAQFSLNCNPSWHELWQSRLSSVWRTINCSSSTHNQNNVKYVWQNKQTTTTAITTRKHNIKLMLNNNKEKKQMQHDKITVINLDWWLIDLGAMRCYYYAMLCFSCLTLWLIDWLIECNDFNLTYANVCDAYRHIMNWIFKDIDIQMWIHKRII